MYGRCRKRLSFAEGFVASHSCAGVAELADALDSKSSDRKIVWVRAPPPAMTLKHRFIQVNLKPRAKIPRRVAGLKFARGRRIVV
jgi:hypothetical protein